VVSGLPAEVTDVERFVKLSERAEYCLVKRGRNVVKLKLRTARRLYTLKVKPEDAEGILSRIGCEIREI